MLDGKTDAAAVAAAIASSTGIFLTAPDRSLVADALAAQQAVMDAVEARWKAGKVLLADDAAAAVLGSRYVADPISPDVEASAMEDMLVDGVTVANGLGWVANARVEPRLLPDQNWGQAHPPGGRRAVGPGRRDRRRDGPRGLATGSPPRAAPAPPW